MEIVNEEEHKKIMAKRMLQIKNKNKDVVKEIDVNKLLLRSDEFVEKMYSTGTLHKNSHSENLFSVKLAQSM